MILLVVLGVVFCVGLVKYGSFREALEVVGLTIAAVILTGLFFTVVAAVADAIL